MNLKHLTNEQLDLATKMATDQERSATLKVLWHLRENERRMLYAERGHKDLKTYCVKELKMSEGSAWRRISAMKLLKEIPETELKFQTGELNLTQACQAQALFRQVMSTPEEKREILGAIENQSKAATERILAEKGLDEESGPKERAVRGGKVEVTLVLDAETLKQMEKIEILLGKKFTKLELIRLMVTRTLATLQRVQKNAKRNPRRRRGAPEGDPQAAPNAAPKAASKTAPKAASRTPSRIVVREIKTRDEHRCQYQDPMTGQRCDARHGLQIEHKIPFAKGGKNTVDNLELLCANHNRFRAVQQFGATKMKKFLRDLD